MQNCDRITQEEDKLGNGNRWHKCSNKSQRQEVPKSPSSGCSQLIGFCKEGEERLRCAKAGMFLTDQVHQEKDDTPNVWVIFT
jgi:hypothetical protein